MREYADGLRVQHKTVRFRVRQRSLEAQKRADAAKRHVLRQLRLRLSRNTKGHTVPPPAGGHMVYGGRTLRYGLWKTALRRFQLQGVDKGSENTLNTNFIITIRSP